MGRRELDGVSHFDGGPRRERQLRRLLPVSQREKRAAIVEGQIVGKAGGRDVPIHFPLRGCAGCIADDDGHAVTPWVSGVDSDVVGRLELLDVLDAIKQEVALRNLSRRGVIDDVGRDQRQLDLAGRHQPLDDARAPQGMMPADALGDVDLVGHDQIERGEDVAHPRRVVDVVIGDAEPESESKGVIGAARPARLPRGLPEFEQRDGQVGVGHATHDADGSARRPRVDARPGASTEQPKGRKAPVPGGVDAIVFGHLDGAVHFHDEHAGRGHGGRRVVRRRLELHDDPPEDDKAPVGERWLESDVVANESACGRDSLVLVGEEPGGRLNRHLGRRRRI